MNIPNICKECKPRVGGTDHEGIYYEIVPCPRHALVDRLAEALRQYHLWHINDYGGAGQMDAKTAELLKEYDSATFTANRKERV